jgi:hypothetical protein
MRRERVENNNQHILPVLLQSWNGRKRLRHGWKHQAKGQGTGKLEKIPAIQTIAHERFPL